MFKTPKSLRLHIGLFGRTNVGKSSFLNYITGQEVAITSPVPGTTTDVVEKPMELLPIGPVVFLDTAGLDDTSVLAERRIKKTRQVFDRSDVVVLLTEPGQWGPFEDDVVAQATRRQAPLIAAVNKADVTAPSQDFLDAVRQHVPRVLTCACTDKAGRDKTVWAFKKYLIDVVPDEFLNPPALIGDLLPRGGLAVFIIPVDKEAPKGRIILPQVQAMRDILDSDSMVLVVKESEYASALKRLKKRPDIVVCDSQVVDRMVADTPKGVPCTTFSILFSRIKADLVQAAIAVAALDRLKRGDKVLIVEACTHHAIEDDIGRVKIPKWLKKRAGFDVAWEVKSGKDFPEDLREYKAVISCGSCMFTRREMLARVEKARLQGVAFTNYGVAIAFLQGVLERVLGPFPDALRAYRATQKGT
jgi:[FeFe] hydrogenase H-cluster maturation GTPase HydF